MTLKPTYTNNNIPITSIDPPQKKSMLPSPLTTEQVRQWREQGYVIVSGMVDVSVAQREMESMYPLHSKDGIVHDFGSGSEKQFPIKDCPGLNNVTVNPTLIAAAAQLLARGWSSPAIPKLLQSVAWAKFGDAPNARESNSNHEQRIHMDYGNNTWLHPPPWDSPTAVAAIVYYSDVTVTGGGTAVTPRNGPKDPIYEYPYRHMPGQGNIPFVNDRDKAEAMVKSVSEESFKIRQEAYAREIHTCPKPGDVLLYRLDVWHRGTPVKAGTVRYVHNLLWTLPDAAGMCTWNAGYTIPMYYGWLEKFIATLEPIQLLSLGFPPRKHPYWNKHTIEGVKMRYGNETVDRLLSSKL